MPVSCRLLIVMLLLSNAGCPSPAQQEAPAPPPAIESGKENESGSTNRQDEFSPQRSEMIERQIKSRGIQDENVLRALAAVPRHEFVPEEFIDDAYSDGPLPIGHGQTISQPYIVALMTQAVHPARTDKVLDIGTGSGYQAAVLAELVDRVWSIEIVEPLATAAEKRLQRLGYDNVIVRTGDGFQGWPEEAPFDVIVLAAAPEEIPPALIDQLAPGGRLVLPVGERNAQVLVLIEKDLAGEVSRREIGAVRFVPMTGEAEGANTDKTAPGK